MAFDYTDVLATAKELTEEFGRAITVQRLDTTPADNAKPWRGPADPTATVDGEVSLFGVSVPPDSLIRLGLEVQSPELVQRSKLIFIAAPDDADTDISAFNHLVDYDGQSYRVTVIHTLRPAEVQLLHFIGVEG